MQAGISRLLVFRGNQCSIYVYGQKYRMIGRDTIGKSFIGNEKYYQNIPWR